VAGEGAARQEHGTLVCVEREIMSPLTATTTTTQQQPEEEEA